MSGTSKQAGGRLAPDGRRTVAGGANPRDRASLILNCALEGRGRSAGHLPPPRWGEWIHGGIRLPGARTDARPPATVQCPSGTTGARASALHPRVGGGPPAPLGRTELNLENLIQP
jgi:hypothetical protein